MTDYIETIIILMWNWILYWHIPICIEIITKLVVYNNAEFDCIIQYNNKLLNLSEMY